MKSESTPQVRAITLEEINAGRLEAAADGTFVKPTEYPDYAGAAAAERSEARLHPQGSTAAEISADTKGRNHFAELDVAYAGYLRKNGFTPPAPTNSADHLKR